MSKEQYPLIRELGLEMIELMEPINFDEFKPVKVVYASDLERELEKGVKIDLVKLDNKIGISSTQDATHTALLIGIESIQKDTAESLLREVLDYSRCAHVDHSKFMDICARASELLEDKE